jgi:hypothetical protein
MVLAQSLAGYCVSTTGGYILLLDRTHDGLLFPPMQMVIDLPVPLGIRTPSELLH